MIARPVDGGTEITQTGSLDPNLLGRLLSPVVRAMLGKRFRLIADELSRYTATALPNWLFNVTVTATALPAASTTAKCVVSPPSRETNFAA